jgi:anti-sigma regulatory factor (Ser/Thr protein kinase)
MPTVELRFGALPGHVRTARLITAAICRRVGVPADLTDEIKLAVGEACTRAVAVNRRHAPDAPVVVRLTDSDGEFAIAVHDSGPTGDARPPDVDGFGEMGAVGGPDGQAADAEPAAWENEPLAGRGEENEEEEAAMPTGLGLALIEGLVDEMDIAPGVDGGGTVVTMRWRTNPTIVSTEPERALAES